MGTKKDDASGSLQRSLSWSDQELMNVGRLSSLVYHYEKIEWEDAKQEAARLLREKKAEDYIKKVRTDKAVKAYVDLVQPEPKEPKKATPFDDPMYNENYQRLLKLAPGIIDRLRDTDFKIEQLYGKSERTGYRDLSLDAVAKEKNEYYLTLTQYDGKLKPSPSMILRIDLEDEILEALEFTDPLTSKRVYSMENRRKFIDLEEQETQNEFLTNWLKKLLDQKHLIKWKERAAHGVESLILDKYKMSEREAELKPPKEEKEEKEQKAEKEPKAEKEQNDKPAKVTFSETDRKNLLAAVRMVEDVQGEKAEEIVNDLIEGKNVLQYLLSGYGKLWKKKRSEIVSSNYKRLVQIIPDLMHKLTNGNITVRLKASDALPIYDFAYGEDKKGSVRKFAVYESKASSTEGTIIIGVRPSNAYIEHLSGNFFDHEDFYDLSMPPSVAEVEEMRDLFAKWLDFLTVNNYRPEWSEIDETKVIVPPAAVEDPDDDSDYINDGIPDFEIGQVKLVEAHKKHGVDQKVIDFINKTGQGVTLKPREGAMVFNTKNRELDAAIQAKQPGLRLSAHGKFYNEGRSNRADRTHNQGL